MNMNSWQITSSKQISKNDLTDNVEKIDDVKVKITKCFITSRDISAFKGNNRNYFALDVLINNRRIGSITNYDESNLPPVYTVEKFPFGAFSGDFDLNEGIKEVKILFPWSAKTVLQKCLMR